MSRASFQGDLQIAWDSTSLKTFQACPRKYYYSLIQSFSSRGESVHLSFGLHYHKAMERFHHAATRAQISAGRIADGRSEAIRSLPVPDRERVLDEVVQGTLEDTAGWRSDDKYKNRETLLRSIVWWTDQFGFSDPAETYILASGAPAVELSFRFELPINNPDGDPYLYCGHLDRVAQFLGAGWVFDYKSTKTPLLDFYWSQWSPNNQMSGYTYGSRVAVALPVKGVMIEAVQVQVGASIFARRPTRRTEAQLDEWLGNTMHSIKLAEGYAASGFWPMNLESCGNYGGCPFREVCSKSPSQRETWLRSDYDQRTWDPLRIRGDI